MGRYHFVVLDIRELLPVSLAESLLAEPDQYRDVAERNRIRWPAIS